MKLDRVIAVRNNKTIYRDGDRTVKVFSTDYSKADILNEALNQARIEETGLKIPKILEVTMVDGKWAIVAEYIKGKTLAQLMKENPEKNKDFKVLIPKRDKDHYGENPSVSKLKNFARQIGDHMSYWWEWALTIAQRIANGESWESLCNEPDTANWYLLVEWYEHSRMVGGSILSYQNFPAAHIDSYTFWDHDWVKNTVPLVVDYDD